MAPTVKQTFECAADNGDNPRNPHFHPSICARASRAVAEHPMQSVGEIVERDERV